MSRQEKFEKIFNHCFVKMFRAVGEKYPNKELTDKPQWYRLRKWSILEEKLFRDWMVSYLRKEAKLTKNKAEIEAGFFLLNFGWINHKKDFDKSDGETIMVIRK